MWLQISMVDATLFEHLEAVAQHVRRSKAPFGGIQLVLTGAAPWPIHVLVLHGT